MTATTAGQKARKHQEVYLNGFLSYFELPLSPKEAEMFIIDSFANVKQLFPSVWKHPVLR